MCIIRIKHVESSSKKNKKHDERVQAGQTYTAVKKKKKKDVSIHYFATSLLCHF